MATWKYGSFPDYPQATTKQRKQIYFRPLHTQLLGKKCEIGENKYFLHEFFGDRENGLYFSDLENLHIWLRSDQKNEMICEVRLLPDSKFLTESLSYISIRDGVYCMRQQYNGSPVLSMTPNIRVHKTDHFVLCNPVPVQQFLIEHNLVEITLRFNPGALVFFDEQSQDMCETAVQASGLELQIAKHRSDVVCHMAIKNDYRAIQWVEDQTLELCELAIKNNYRAIQWIKNQTSELCELAIKNNYRAIQWIKNQTPELCDMAIRSGGWNALKYIMDREMGGKIYAAIINEIPVDLRKKDYTLDDVPSVLAKWYDL